MTILIKNKKVGLTYEILDSYTAGVVLSGGEVKSLRNRQGSMDGSYISLRENQHGRPELWLRNVTIPPYQAKNTSEGYNPENMRKLLVQKKEIQSISKQLNTAGITMVPLSFDALGDKIKMRFALARGKKKYDKREDMKKRTAARDVDREIKARMR